MSVEAVRLIAISAFAYLSCCVLKSVLLAVLPIGISLQVQFLPILKWILTFLLELEYY